MSKPRTKYLYHLTDPESLDDILANGLKPKIGPRSKLVCEIEPRIYLCDRKSIPYWSALLDKYTVIRIAMPVDAFDKFFTEDGDEKFVDYVEEITESEYKDAVNV